MPLVKLELKSVLVCLWQYLDVTYSRFYIGDRVSLLRKMDVRLYLEGRWRLFSIWNRLDLMSGVTLIMYLSVYFLFT